MATNKVLAGGAREFTFTAAFSMDSTSCWLYLYWAGSGNTTSVASAMATSSGAGTFFCTLTIPTSPVTGYYWSRWAIPYGTTATGSDATWVKTQRLEICVEGEDE